MREGVGRVGGEEKTGRTVAPPRTLSIRNSYSCKHHAKTANHKKKTDDVERPEDRHRLLPECGCSSVGGTRDNMNLSLRSDLAHANTESEHDGDGEDGDEDGEHACNA
jgi:hypothetical protein